TAQWLKPMTPSRLSPSLPPTHWTESRQNPCPLRLTSIPTQWTIHPVRPRLALRPSRRYRQPVRLSLKRPYEPMRFRPRQSLLIQCPMNLRCCPRPSRRCFLSPILHPVHPQAKDRHVLPTRRPTRSMPWTWTSSCVLSHFHALPPKSQSIHSTRSDAFYS